MLYSWNLLWFCIFVRPFIWQIELGVKNRASEGRNEKTSQNEPENQFF